MLFNGKAAGKAWKNSQRCTVLTARRAAYSTRDADVWTTGLLRSEGERKGWLEARPTVRRRVKGDQWDRVGSPAIADMLQRLRAQEHTVREWEGNGYAVGYPPTGRYFVTLLPWGYSRSRGETRIGFENEEKAKAAMVLWNSHIGYNWWQTIGDGFHLKENQIWSLPIPDSVWGDPDELGNCWAKVARALPSCEKVKRNAGKVCVNYDPFMARDVIAKNDELILQALSYEEEEVEEVLADLQTVRSSCHRRLYRTRG